MADKSISANPVMPAGLQQQWLTQAYANTVNLDDSLKRYSGSIMSPLSMSGLYNTMSFNNPVMSGLYSGMPGLFSGTYGCYGPGSETWGMTLPQYAKYQTGVQIQQAQLADFAKGASVAPANARSSVAGLLDEAFKNHDLENIKILYNRLKQIIREEYIKAGYSNISEEQISAAADEAYFEVSGRSFTDAMAQCGDTPFVQGLKWGTIVGIPFTSPINNKKALEQTKGTPQTFADQAWRVVGCLLPAALVAGAAALFHKANLGTKLGGVWEEAKLARETNKAFAEIANAEKAVARQGTGYRDAIIREFKLDQRENVVQKVTTLEQEFNNFIELARNPNGVGTSRTEQSIINWFRNEDLAKRITAAKNAREQEAINNITSNLNLNFAT